MFENIKCIVCDTVSVNITEYLSHIRIHRRDKQFACPFTECEKKFGSFQSFRKHIRFRHVEQNLQSSARSYRCSLAECDFEEQNFERIMRHATAHISSGQPVYCPLRCPTKKPFATSNSFRIHKIYAHRRGLKKPELLLLQFRMHAIRKPCMKDFYIVVLSQILLYSQKAHTHAKVVPEL